MTDYILSITFLCGILVCFIALLVYVALTGELPPGLGWQ